MPKIVCISDTHCRLRKVTIPDGDILIHAGDLTFDGSIKQTSQELRELGRYRSQFKGILLVEGNHDWLGAKVPELMEKMCKDHGITLLRDSSVTIDGIKFYGSPYTPEFFNWAWMYDRAEGQKIWQQIPDDTNVLITHGPPMGILDTVMKFNSRTGEQVAEHVGCVDLYNRVMELKNLKLHVFGHLHFSHGTMKIGDIRFVNASICTEEYKPTNSPWSVMFKGD